MLIFFVIKTTSEVKEIILAIVNNNLHQKIKLFVLFYADNIAGTIISHSIKELC